MTFLPLLCIFPLKISTQLLHHSCSGKRASKRAQGFVEIELCRGMVYIAASHSRSYIFSAYTFNKNTFNKNSNKTEMLRDATVSRFGGERTRRLAYTQQRSTGNSKRPLTSLSLSLEHKKTLYSRRLGRASGALLLPKDMPLFTQ
jgi:hypothetical protein